MARLTAKQAKEISGPTLEEEVGDKVDALLVAIEGAAKQKRRSLKTGWEYKENEDLWIRGGYSGSKDWNLAKKMLEELGYKVSFYYQENQFVDMYTLIEW